jgi:hypothetical protein
MMALAVLRKQPGRRLLEMALVGKSKRVPGLPPWRYLKAALDYLVENTQKNMNCCTSLLWTEARFRTTVRSLFVSYVLM